MIYLDNAATTQIDPLVLESMLPYLKENYGNSSSLHKKGRNAKNALEESRKTIAKLLNCKEEEIIFTSGGSESNNLAIKGIAQLKGSGHIITSKIEHPAVLETCKALEEQGFEVTYLNSDKEGFISPKDLEQAIKKNTILVTIMHANNEVGTIQDITNFSEICKNHNIPFHTDAVQTFGKIPIDLTNITLASFSAHKIHGPKGIGALYIKEDTELKKQIDGGAHEFNFRAGTENMAGIVGFVKAAELAYENMDKPQTKLRDKLITELLKIKDSWLNGSQNNRLPNNVNISFRHAEGEAILLRLDEKGIAISTGSACSTKNLQPSHVLLALGLKQEDTHGSIRITLSRFNTKKEIDQTIKEITQVVKDLRNLTPFGE